jgi:hypothetical protein
MLTAMRKRRGPHLSSFPAEKKSIVIEMSALSCIVTLWSEAPANWLAVSRIIAP